ncbi:hypothetical protein ACVXZ0_12875 [Staphylococcus aureus]
MSHANNSDADDRGTTGPMMSINLPPKRNVAFSPKPIITTATMAYGNVTSPDCAADKPRCV